MKQIVRRTLLSIALFCFAASPSGVSAQSKTKAAAKKAPVKAKVDKPKKAEAVKPKVPIHFRLATDTTFAVLSLKHIQNSEKLFNLQLQRAGLLKKWQKAVSDGPADLKAFFKRKMLPKTVSQILALWGWDANATFALLPAYSKEAKTAGVSFVFEYKDEKRIHSTFMGTVGKALSDEYRSACTREMRELRKKYIAQPQNRALIDNLISYSSLKKAFPKSTFFGRCPHHKGCQVARYNLKCKQKGKLVYGYYIIKKRYQKAQKQPLPKQKLKGGWLYGSFSHGIFYALLQGKYHVFSTHPLILKEALQAFQKGGSTVQNVTTKAKAKGIGQAFISHTNIINSVSHYSKHSGRSQRALREFKWLGFTQQSLLETWLSLSASYDQVSLQGSTSGKKKGRFATFLKVPPQKRWKALSYIPKEVLALGVNNYVQPGGELIRQLLKKVFPAANLMWTVFSSLLGKEMAVAIVPGAPGTFQMLVTVEFLNVIPIKKLLRDLESMGPAAQLVKTSVKYRGKELRSVGVLDPYTKVRRELTYTFDGNLLLLTAEINASPQALLKEMLRVRARKSPSIWQNKAFRAFLKQRGASNALGYVSFPRIHRHLVTFPKTQQRVAGILMRFLRTLGSAYVSLRAQGNSATYNAKLRTKP